MQTFMVEVGVATCRPPTADHYIYYVIAETDGNAAELTACIWAAQHYNVVYPVSSVVYDWE